MTYLQFHFVFTIPVIVALGLFFLRNPEKWPGRRGTWSLPAVALIALIYTTAWDNYLVYRGVWGYGADRVVGTIGYVPIEEYLFFILQPLMSGLWFYLLLAFENEQPSLEASQKARWIGVGIYSLIALAGIVLLQYERGLYMGLILVWAGPVLAGQWGYIGQWIWPLRRLYAWGIIIPTLYLWIADCIAIGLGIWFIEERYTFGFNPFGLPIEEATFFLVTNLLVVQGLIMFLKPGIRS